MAQNVFQNTIRGIIIYDATYVVGFILMLLLSLFRCKAYGISRKRAVSPPAVSATARFVSL